MIEGAPATAEALRATIVDRYDALSERHRQIARYVLDEPNAFALETVAVIAERCGVQPSAIIRFAKSFGYPGASQMQRLFRDSLLSGQAPGLGERVRHFDKGSGGAEVLEAFVEGDIQALRSLLRTVNEADLRAAAGLIAEAEMVYVVGFRRSFPVASYLAHALQYAGKRAFFVDGMAGRVRQQVQSIGPRDLLIAVSSHPYAEETMQAAAAAVQHGARVLSISDSPASPIAASAQLVLPVREAETGAFRSVAASICLVQALVFGFPADIAGDDHGVAKVVPLT
ncbi:MurR/RpiR family transcriptional regulator [Caulobacter segnis]